LDINAQGVPTADLTPTTIPFPRPAAAVKCPVESPSGRGQIGVAFASRERGLVRYMINELTATLTATQSTISPSTKIITHNSTPDRELCGPSRTLRMDLRIRRLRAAGTELILDP
jgi:hypothetical protein